MVVGCLGTTRDGHADLHGQSLRKKQTPSKVFSLTGRPIPARVLPAELRSASTGGITGLSGPAPNYTVTTLRDGFPICRAVLIAALSAVHEQRFPETRSLNAAPLGRGQETSSNYYPLKVGSKWTYRAAEDQKVLFRVAKAEQFKIVRKEKDKEMTEDERDKGKEEVQTLLKTYEDKITELADKKTKEVMEQ